MRNISGAEAIYLRELYIASFINTECDVYRERIEGKKYYSGYLWDCLNDRTMITEKKAMDLIRNMPDIFLMTNFCLNESEDNCKECTESCIFCGGFDELMSLIPQLPEDIYFFDESLTWTIALTHEYNDKGRRYCLITDGRM